MIETTTPTYQPSLPQVRAEHAGGQIELVDPGPRVERETPGDGDGDGDGDDRQLDLFGVKPGARWRRRDAQGSHVPWDQLDLQLAGIKKRRKRDGCWDPNRAAVRTMDHVRAQTYNAADLGQLDAVSLPGWARGRWDLTPAEERLLGALWRAYANDTGGVYELQTTLASDLGFTDRTLRNALNGRGGKCPRPGLIERGLVVRAYTHREGTNGRKVDSSWLLLRIGPEIERIAIGLIFASGRKPPRRSGLRRAAARKARSTARREARQLRRAKAGAAWNARRERPALGASARAPASVPASGSLSTAPAGGEARGASSKTKAEKLAPNLPARRGARTSPLNRRAGGGYRGAAALAPDPPAGNERAPHVAPLASPPAGAVDKLPDAGTLAGARALAPRAGEISKSDVRWLAFHELPPDADDLAVVRDAIASSNAPGTTSNAASDPKLARMLADCLRSVIDRSD